MHLIEAPWNHPNPHQIPAETIEKHLTIDFDALTDIEEVQPT